MNHPVVSIVTPSYNQAEFLERAMRSVLEQEYAPIEYLVIDGGSTDSSQETIAGHASQLAYWVSERDGGQASAINKGWSRATGAVLGWLNSDDEYEPGAIQQVVDVFRRCPTAKVVFGDCRIVDRRGGTLGIKRPSGHSLERLLTGRSLPQPSVFISRDVVEDVGYLDESLHYALDWAYFVKVFSLYPSHALVYVPAVLSRSRDYAGTKSRTGLAYKGDERRRVLSAYFDQGLLPASHRLRNRSWSATYWVQGMDEFRAGLYGEALLSCVRAVRYDPLSFLPRVPRAANLLRARVRIRHEARVVGHETE